MAKKIQGRFFQKTYSIFRFWLRVQNGISAIEGYFSDFLALFPRHWAFFMVYTLASALKYTMRFLALCRTNTILKIEVIYTKNQIIRTMVKMGLQRGGSNCPKGIHYRNN